MTLTEEQIEWIVREVVRRLEAAHSTNGPPKPSDPQSVSHLRLSERLITTETLRHRLEGVRVLEVAPRAIVTPAVIDLLKDRTIQLQRTTIKGVT